MFTEEGIFPIGDGLLDVDAERLKGLLVSHDINEIYEVEQTPFARGKFAAVRRAIHKNSGSQFAAKFLKRRRRAQSSDKEIKHEIAVLMLCKGEDNIVNLNAVHETRSDTALLLELATGGELQTILDNEECLSEAQARHCMRETLKALKFLHDRSIAHLDLKPQNILLTGERIEDGLKLCDFGISRVVCEGINVREMAGTPDYVAPEVLQYEPLSLLTDIWSVGVLAYVLLSGFSPFGGDTKQETFLNISQCALTFPDNLFGGVSQAAIDFIRRALRIKPNDRMNAAGCLEHVWLKDECSLNRQIYLQAQHDADFVQDDEDEDDDDDEEDEEEDDDEQGIKNVSQQQQQQQQQQQNGTTTAATAAAATPASKATHNGHRAHSSSKIPIATSHKLSPSTETTTAIHTLPQALTMSLATNATKPTQIVTPIRRASDSDKENTYTATFVKKPMASTATIQIGSNGLEETTVIATLALFPDAPTTPKVIRKTPAAEASAATSVKALVKKFQLDELEAHNSNANSNLASTITQLQLQQPRKCSVPSIAMPTSSSSSNMRRSISGTASSSNSSNGSNGNGNGSCNNVRRASEPLTAVHKKQHNISPNSISSSNSNTNSNSSNSSSSSSSGSSNNPSGSGSGSSSSSAGGSSTALLLNGRLPAAAAAAAHHLHHHHMHHHHHHHHHHVVIAAKNAAAAATNNLSLDQGIIC
ncbi:death-associated protein kinase related [Drosophila hydei]|uniref:non-specific serine/threonine protein kinase n=1 Tax=Drosophila hydei TaxID=7224 RepID=A0A6J2SVC2_DROHY|nr:death-associated protein kinase related [Drosophila hydei]XP_030080158.1 death-associated protein kinase related [Drosophila hydei]XP_030080159.1 death-associated protein kinase related [Drosophila hydei]XP_030080160.1 death-associated protein kinase related [Drosophila hydei]XP_030080161.1 death-associated protein kinase related [Drosophila hydei]XP_030080162.1 death-associated protein kinase related [Drosophila hydei]